MTDIADILAAAQPERFYVFSVDWLNQGTNLGVIQQYMKDSRMISTWAYYTPGVFLLKSRADVHTLADALTKVSGSANNLLIEANPSNAGGWLPQHAWEWINNQRPTGGLLRYVPPPPGLINSLSLPPSRKDDK